MADLPSSPPRAEWSSMEEELNYYKTQYETLEAELLEFQASSKELEAELEKDVEESEKRERKLKENVERLGFEVEEWQTKYKQSKAEANNAQNALQKEITALRESQRSLQLQLRDIEVQNDDFERQARHQNSSLEDLESKYNVAIERSVMLDEEIKIGEQERESLRIETQRLRDELSDLRIEAEIVQEKLRLAEETIERHHQRKTSNLLAGGSLRARSPVSEASTSATTLSSPTDASTPPQKNPDAERNVTPPSPPLSEASITARPAPATPMPAQRKKSIALDPSATPRPGMYSQRPPRHSRGPSVPSVPKGAPTPSGRATPSIRTTTPAYKGSRPSVSGAQPGGLPRSETRRAGVPRKIETTGTNAYPPRASPRNGSALGHHVPTIPSTVTVRSNRKRASQASTADSGISRLSFGVSQSSNSRPSSRASVTSAPQRPGSRSSNRTQMGHYSQSSIGGVDGRIPRPRSSLSGPMNHGHSHSTSLSGSVREDEDSNSEGGNATTPVPRRLTMEKTGIPTPSGLPRRMSQGRRISSGLDGSMAPPARPRKMSEVEEF